MFIHARSSERLPAEKKNETGASEHRLVANSVMGEAVVARYEGLRCQVLAHDGPGRGDWGYALFVHKGMAAWMAAWGRCMPDSEQERPAATPQAGADSIPQLVRNDVVMVLAAMALSHLQEMIR